jgi:hypothetical protein
LLDGGRPIANAKTPEMAQATAGRLVVEIRFAIGLVSFYRPPSTHRAPTPAPTPR